MFLLKSIRVFSDYLVFTSLFIAGCAVLMVHQTNQLLDLHYDIIQYLWFVFFSTICSYNFHWWLTPDIESEIIRIKWTAQHKTLHLCMFIIGLAGSVWFYFYFIDSWLWMGISAFLTFLYSAPKLPHKIAGYLQKIAVGKTIFLAMVWMYVTTALPILIAAHLWRAQEILFCISRFFLIYAICIVFDYRDREYDKQQGIRSLITYLNGKGIDLLFYISVLIFMLSTSSLYFFGFRPAIILLLLVPAIILLLLYRTAKRNFSDYLYYVVLDGLMMFSALFTSFLRI